MHTHFVAVVIYRKNQANEEVEFLVIDYRSINPRTGQKTQLQTKFVGGTNKECPRESVEATRDREVLEEASLSFQTSKQVWKKEVSSDHTRYGFIVDFRYCEGELRQVPINDDGDALSVPYWVPATTLGRVLWPSHQGLYLAAISELGL